MGTVAQREDYVQTIRGHCPLIEKTSTAIRPGQYNGRMSPPQKSALSPVTDDQRNTVKNRLRQASISGEHVPRSVLSRDTRLSGAALSRVLKDLYERDVLKPLVSGNGSGGRSSRPGDHVIDTKQGCVLAFGFGHERLGVAVTDLAGNMLGPEGDLVEDFGSVDTEPTRALSDAARLGIRAMAGTDTERQKIVGIGVSLPAPLDEQRRLYPGFMDAWQSRYVADELLRRLELGREIPVELENDANLIALREHRRGGARGSTHACVVKWGTGLGAGFIIDGRVYTGPRGLAGEIGHIPTEGIEAAEELTKIVKETCPRCHKPCLESLIAKSGLLTFLRESPDGDIRDVITSGIDGHEPSRRAFRIAARLLGHKLGPIVSALNLQRVVIDCFSDARAFELIVGGLKTGLEGRMTPSAYHQLTVQAAACGQTAAILGAADRVLDRHLGSWVGRQEPRRVRVHR
jgi:predicted NBD/HSP70 family sugar kinase